MNFQQQLTLKLKKSEMSDTLMYKRIPGLKDGRLYRNNENRPRRSWRGIEKSQLTHWIDIDLKVHCF